MGLLNREGGYMSNQTINENMKNYTEEHGYLIDYDTKWFARLYAAPHTEKYGWRVFCKDGTLAGI